MGDGEGPGLKMSFLQLKAEGVVCRSSLLGPVESHLGILGTSVGPRAKELSDSLMLCFRSFPLGLQLQREQ